MLACTLVARAAIIAIVARILFNKCGSRIRTLEVGNGPGHAATEEQDAVHLPFSLDLRWVSIARNSQNPSTEFPSDRIPDSPFDLTLILPL